MASIKELMKQGKLAPAPTGEINKSVEGSLADRQTNPPMRADAPMPSPTKPIRSNSNEVIFKSGKRNFNFMWHGRDVSGQQIQFNDGYLLTSDHLLIKHIEENYLHYVSIWENGSLAEEKTGE